MILFYFRTTSGETPSNRLFNFYFIDLCHAFHAINNLASCLKIRDGTKLRLDLKGNMQIEKSYCISYFLLA